MAESSAFEQLLLVAGLSLAMYALQAPPGIRVMAHPFQLTAKWRQNLPVSVSGLEPGNEV